MYFILRKGMRIGTRVTISRMKKEYLWICHSALSNKCCNVVGVGYVSRHALTVRGPCQIMQVAISLNREQRQI